MRALPKEIDRSGPPEPTAERLFRFPDFCRHRLPSGLEVIIAPMGRVPMVSLDFYAPAGAYYDPPQRAGLATLTAATLDEGTRHRTGSEIAAAVERLGGSLSTGAGWNAAFATTTVLSKDLVLGTELLRDVVMAPVFPQREVERLRGDRLAELLQRRNDPGALAARYLARAIFGSGLYGRSADGDEDTVAAIRRSEVEEFYRCHFSAQGSFLIAVGDLDPQQLLTDLDSWQGQLPAARQPQEPEHEIVSPQGVQVHVVNRPGASQTELRLGHAGVERTHPDFAPLTLLNAILGGKFTSRINLNLREKRGYTYGASSRFVGRRHRGPFTVSTAVGTEVAGAAAREALGEIRRIQQAPVTQEELHDAQSYLQGVFVQGLQTIEDVAQRLGTLALHGLPNDYWDSGYLEQIAAADENLLLDLARKHLHPEQMAVVAVGPADQLRTQFEDLGEVTEWNPETDLPEPSS